MPLDPDPRLTRHRWLALLAGLAFFTALAPTLPWQEFSSGPENLVVATSMEIRRGGPWLIPTLQGEPRVAKPPLAAWITAAAIWPRTLRDIDSQVHFLRQRGFLFLALEARAPALISACLLLFATFALGRAIRDSTLGLMAMAICGSTYFLLRFARYSTTDIQLALWVTWANAFLANAILRDKRWSGFIGAGITLGLAMLSKGPVCLIQSAVPVLVFLWMRRRIATEAAKPLGRVLWAGAVLFIGIGFWWYVLVLARNQGVILRWFSEVTRVGATETPSSSIFAYLGIIGYVVPWVVFLIVGFVVIVRQVRDNHLTNDLLPLLLLVVPLLIMTIAKDRQDRYTLPMIPAAAIVAAIGVREYLLRWRTPDTLHRVVAALHWITLGAIAIALPLLGATRLLKQVNGEPWFTWRFALTEAAVGAVLVIAGVRLHRTRAGALVAMTFITMLLTQAVLFKGYCSSNPGRSDMKPMADILAARYPDATFYNAHPKGKRPPTDLGVYLNRTIHWTADASSLSVSQHPIILFMLQNKGDPEPNPPAGWHFEEKAKRDKDWWWAFVLPPE